MCQKKTQKNTTKYIDDPISRDVFQPVNGLKKKKNLEKKKRGSALGGKEQEKGNRETETRMRVVT